MLAGDLAPYRPAVIRELVRAWGEKGVLYVPGNHDEFYGGDIDQLRAALARHCVEAGIDLRIVRPRAFEECGSSGYPLDRFQPLRVERAFAFKDLAQRNISDFHVIGRKGRSFTPEEDNDCTPFVAIASDMDGVTVPPGTAKDGRVVLNLSASATRNLEISNERLTVDCRFGGKPFHVTAPMGAVVAVFARESGEGMSFEPSPANQTPSAEGTAPTKPPPKQGPKLTLVT